jgi:hypothetical protein
LTQSLFAAPTSPSKNLRKLPPDTPLSNLDRRRKRPFANILVNRRAADAEHGRHFTQPNQSLSIERRIQMLAIGLLLKNLSLNSLCFMLARQPMFFVGRAVLTSVCSPGTGESKTRLRLAFRTSSVATSCRKRSIDAKPIPCADSANRVRPSVCTAHSQSQSDRSRKPPLCDILVYGGPT